MALELDGGTLPIQGPPGTGKTYAGARMIIDLVRARKVVAITAQSHKTISNLLEAVMAAAAEEGVGVEALQKADEDKEHVGHLDGVTRTDSNTDVAAALAAGTVDVVAGTPWLFARDELNNAFDVLFVDEASQMSLASTVAIGTCARSIVLIGDPNQLPMVSQGVHPVGASASSLEHLVGDVVTVPADRGLFLETSRRMHPDVNAFISPAFYAGLLETHPDTARRVVDGDHPVLSGSGVRWLPTLHRGNGPRSREEAEVVAEAVDTLLRMTHRHADGDHRPIELDDVIVIAPYNAQVAEIQAALERRLGRRGNVGTVDKFQGREGVVAIYSMASSSREDAPRDMGFLYMRNRLNVAISRAQSVALLVASPTLLEAGCHTPGADADGRRDVPVRRGRGGPGGPRRRWSRPDPTIARAAAASRADGPMVSLAGQPDGCPSSADADHPRRPRRLVGVIATVLLLLALGVPAPAAPPGDRAHAGRLRVRRPGLRDERQGRQRTPVRRRADRQDRVVKNGVLLSTPFIDLTSLVVQGRRAGRPRSRLPSELQVERAVLRVVHPDRWRPRVDPATRSRRPTATSRSAPARARIITIDHPTIRQPQRRDDRVRASRLPVHRDRRWRRRR